MTLLTQAKAWGAAAARRGVAWRSSLRAEPLVPTISAAWFVAMFAALIWVWGFDPKELASPDEALNRFAAHVLSHHGRPFLSLGFADPEDLAHPRHWVSVGDRALPSYAPVAIYGYALLLRLRWLGLLLIATLPAGAAAAFAAGTAKLLPAGRKWLAAPAPMLGFPAVYWLLRPWMNLSILLICLCWVFFFWAAWCRSGSLRHLDIAILGVGVAAAVRPDYAAYLLLTTLLLTVAQSPQQWRRALGLVCAAGASAVAVNLFLNWLVTGHPSQAAYQIVAARDEGPSQSGGVLGLLRQLLIPMGIPERGMALHFLAKYWLEMGSVAGLTLAQLALVPLLLKKPRLERGLLALALGVMLCFMLSHIDRDLNGAAEHLGLVHHSMPRYWSPLYLLAALPPVLFLGHCRQRAVRVVGGVFVCGLALSGAYEITMRERYALDSLHDFAERSAASVRSLQRRVPETAMVYSAAHDKILWSHWRVGTLGEAEPTAASILRAKQAGIDVFVFEPSLKRPQRAKLDRALGKARLTLGRGGERGLYRVTQAE
jgi:hypothetical protein